MVWLRMMTGGMLSGMKVISLNVWGGRVSEPLKAFFEKNSDVDIFCLQEVYHDAHGKEKFWSEGANLSLLKDLEKLLSSYHCLYHPHLGDWWGLALFVKKDIPIKEAGEYYVFAQKGYDLEKEVRGHTAKNIQYAVVELANTECVVINFHGLWNGQGKSDTEDRIRQSENIVSFIKGLNKPFVLCGDFNLSPDTKSLQIIEKGLDVRNLISEHNVTSTRTSFYTKEKVPRDRKLHREVL
jgi:exonuclease III